MYRTYVGYLRYNSTVLVHEFTMSFLIQAPASHKRKLPNEYDDECKLPQTLNLESHPYTEQPRRTKEPRIMKMSDESRGKCMEYAELLYRCQLCVSIPCILTSPASFLSHIQTRHFTVRDTTQKCPQCQLSFETPVDLQSHQDVAHMNGDIATVATSGMIDDSVDRKTTEVDVQDNNNLVKDADITASLCSRTILDNSWMLQNGTSGTIHEKTSNNASPNTTDINRHDMLYSNCGYHSDKNSRPSSIEAVSDEEHTELSFAQDYEKHARLVREGGNIVYHCCICKVKKPSYNMFSRHLLSATHKRRANAKQCSKRLFNGQGFGSPLVDSDASDSPTDNADYCIEQSPVHSADNRTELQKTLDLILAQSNQMSAPTCIVPLSTNIPMKRMGRPPKRDQSVLFPYQVSGSNPIDLSMKQSDSCRLNQVFYDSRKCQNMTKFRKPTKEEKARICRNNVAYLMDGIHDVNVANSPSYQKDTVTSSDYNHNYNLSNCGNNMKSLLHDSMSSVRERSDLSISSKYVSRLNDMSNSLVRNSHVSRNTESNNGTVVGDDKMLAQRSYHKIADVIKSEHMNVKQSELSLSMVESPINYMKLREILTDKLEYGRESNSPNVDPNWGAQYPVSGNHRNYEDLTDAFNLNPHLSGSTDNDGVSSGLKNVASSVMFASENVSWSCDRCDETFVTCEDRATHILTCPAALYNTTQSDGEKERSRSHSPSHGQSPALQKVG